MTEFSIPNDINKLSRMMEMFDQIQRLEFETEIGIEFSNSIKSALTETIKPYGRECVVKLREQLKLK